MKNCNQIDRMVLDACLTILSYCDMNPVCADCILYDEDKKKCAIGIGHLSTAEKFIKEVKSNDQ